MKECTLRAHRSAFVVSEGLRIARQARKVRRSSLERFEPPVTPMVAAAREDLLEHAGPAVVNHCFRVAYWALTALEQRVEITDDLIETTWVAALLHDMGPRPFEGVLFIERLGAQLRWPIGQTLDAVDAVSGSLTARSRPGVAWALHVGGLGELGYALHRTLMAPDRVTELEERYPRRGFTEPALQLVQAEPRGMFARWFR